MKGVGTRWKSGVGSCRLLLDQKQIVGRGREKSALEEGAFWRWQFDLEEGVGSLVCKRAY